MGWKDPLEKDMATHSSILAWRIPMDRGAWQATHLVKNLPAMWESWVQSLHWEVPLEKGMPTHSSILAWKIPWTEKPGGLQSIGLQRV